MIYFVAPQREVFGIEDYLALKGRGLQGRIVVRTYEELMRQRQLPIGSYVFSAIDRLSRSEVMLAARMWDTLYRSGGELRLLNDPRRVMLRFELLAAAHEAGLNRFRARRATTPLHALRFPVFVRLERAHTGSLTPLLACRRNLNLALVRLRAKGYRLRDLLVLEYCDTADSAGIFYKCSAYAVGDRIIPCALVANSNWVTKHDGRIVDQQHAQQELQYVTMSPHARWLQKVFDLARVDYGRVDYGVRDGVPQLWEINTNPTLGRRRGQRSSMTEEQRKLRAPSRDYVAKRLQEAWEAIDSAEDSEQTVRFAVSGSEERRLRRERRKARRVESLPAVISEWANRPPLAWIRRRPKLGA